MTHILVFTPYIFNLLGMTFIEPDEEIGKNITYINSSKALYEARKHFNCKDIPGLALEDQGGKGAANGHWEARYMLGDYMISTIYNDFVMSDITLALFEDTGFYKVEYYSGGLFKFGKNKGCIFFNISCITNGETLFKEEFCTEEDKPICTPLRTTKGNCIIEKNQKVIIEEKAYQYFKYPWIRGFPAANYCPVSYSFYTKEDYLPNSFSFGISNLHKDYGEIIGKKAFCFESSLLPSTSELEIIFQPICYEVECDRKNNQIIINIGSFIFRCPTYGKHFINPEGFKGEINCPKYDEICSSTELCNDMFDCFDKQSKTYSSTFYYNNIDDELIDINTSDQIFTVKEIKLGLSPCFILTGSYIFYIDGYFSKEVNLLDKVNIDLSTSSGKNIKSVCTFDKTSFSSETLQCDIDICMYPLINEDIYLPINPPQEKGYKFKNWKKIIGNIPGKSNNVKRDVTCLPDIENTFIPSKLNHKGVIVKVIFFPFMENGLKKMNLKYHYFYLFL